MIDLTEVPIEVSIADSFGTLPYIYDLSVLIKCLKLSYQLKKTHVNSIDFINSSASDTIEILKKIKSGDTIKIKPGLYPLKDNYSVNITEQPIDVIFPFSYDIKKYCEQDQAEIEKENYYQVGIDCKFYADFIIN